MLQRAVTQIDISALFQGNPGEMTGSTQRVHRYRRTIPPGINITLDCFVNTAVRCCFIRLMPADSRPVKIVLKERCRLASVASGGWVLAPENHDLSSYWIPQPPRLREIDTEGRILSERKAEITEMQVTGAISSVEMRVLPDHCMDLVIWHIPSEEHSFLTELASQTVIETQPYFIYASHSSYQRVADIYVHLIHGSVYGNNFSWPKHRKICDELDGYALYQIMSALGFSTGKRLYSLIKWQIVLSIISRQAEDGAWYHGEWTDSMESHHRLHCGGIHLLLLALEEEYDEAVRSALDKAAEYLMDGMDNTALGVWFLHDSLEKSVDTMNQSPFSWFFSRALEKSPSNMLVLNTHMDILTALSRYQSITGDKRFQDVMESGSAATSAVMNLQPAEFLYKCLFRAIYLTLLPEAEARALPLPVRAIKRLAWKYFIPGLHYVKAYFPRLVMPGGYIDRALSLKGAAFGYQSVHIWDMIRYLRFFSDENIEKSLSEALNFTYSGPLRAYWKEPKRNMQHALGFWAEALYHLCMSDQSPHYRRWLAEAMLDIEDIGLGQPPSLLGLNGETSPVSNRFPCPSLRERQLRIANLSRNNAREVLLVNPTNATLPLIWEDNNLHFQSWLSPDGRRMADSHGLEVPARGWLLGRDTVDTN